MLKKNISKKKMLIIGGTGFIGYHVAVEAIKSLNIGSTTSKANGKAITIAAVLGYGTPTTVAAVELNLKNAMQGSDREAVLKAVERKEKEMLRRRLRKMTTSELSQLSTENRSGIEILKVFLQHTGIENCLDIRCK